MLGGPPARATEAEMSTTAPSRSRASDRALRGGEKRTLAILGLPTFGMALSITTVSTYLSRVAEQFTSSTIVIGLILGGEGIVALGIPLIAGSWSDRLGTPIGGRLPFLLAGTPVMVLALLAMGL